MTVKIFVPTINTNDDDATITVWYVESGSYVEQGDSIAALETTKAAVEVEAEASGHVYYRWPLETQIPVGEVLAILSPTPLTAEELEQCYAVEPATAKQDGAKGSDTRNKPFAREQAQPGESLNQNVSSESTVKITAKARQLIKRHGLSENDFPGTDKITTVMVKSLLDRQSPPAPQKKVPRYLKKLSLSGEKRQEIEALVSSQKQVVQSEVSIDIEWEGFERQLAALSHSNAFRFSPGDLIAYHCARLLPQHPYLNGVYHQDQAYQHEAVNLGYAINLGQGLRVPVLRHADQKDLLVLAKEIREYTMKYTQGRITNKECSQGSFTITDLFSKRIKDFRPVLNTMQAAILGISGVVEGAINLILGFDHRLADGALAADFLQELKTRLESQETATHSQLASAAAHQPSRKQPTIVPKATGDLDRQQLQDDVVALFARVLSIEIAAVDLDRELESYHLNSKTIVQITNELSQRFKGVPASFLFEHRTIESIIHSLLGEPKPETEKDWATFSSGMPSKKERKTARNEEEGIAIIGVAGRYPQAGNLAELWQCLRDGKACFREVPQSRWEMDSYHEDGASRGGKSYCKWGGFLDGVDRFDALFFGISPREAEMMDPQQRLFLEVVWEMMEDAGYTRQTLPRRTGIYVGILSGDYGIYESQAVLEGNDYYRLADYYQVPNRISYHLDLTGPSLAIDTACSASGTAVHLACESLKHNECEMAIVGGVNLILHPSRFIQYSQMQMLSRLSQLGPFSEQADGTLLGEGVGALLLKPLSQAIRDHDNIYGQIKATAINSGGKTNGFTVPNPQAHAQLIRTAIERAKIDSRAISYVEAHGTGTPLGDSVEIRGLSLAFEQATQQQEKQHCALGSIKSNIGHLESNAAIAGITKVLLQMKHGLLVPSLQVQTLNPSIDFEQTPFKVQQELTDWKRPHLRMGDKSVEYPRIAGISSFGAGGSNAHIILQEHEPTALSPSPETGEELFLMPLSAKTTDQLQRVVKRLLTFCSGVNGSLPSLRDIAFTLQTGREAMKARVVFAVKSLAEWQERLQSFLNGQAEAPHVFCSKHSKQSSSWLPSETHDSRQRSLEPHGEEASTRELLKGWVERKDFASLARCWVDGINIDWKLLHAKKRPPSRVSLPTYPFANEHHWIQAAKPGIVSDPTHGLTHVSTLHPLLHQNTSHLSNQRYSSRFTGQEFFLNHHRVHGKKIFPGFGYLEMIRVAIEKSLGLRENGTTLQLKNIVWSQPLMMNETCLEVHIRLFEGSNGRVRYEIYTEEETSRNVTVYCQGSGESKESEAIPGLDFPILKSQMGKGSLNAETCYQIFADMGLEYDPKYRVVREIYRGDNQLLAALSLPASVESTLTDYILHPGLIEAAFQASIGLMTEGAENNPDNLSLGQPYGLESLQVFGACNREMIAWVRPAGAGKTMSSVRKLDIDLYDPHGKVCVTMHGLTTKKWDPARETLQAEDRVGTLLSIPVWQERPVLSDEAPQAFVDHHILLCEMESVRARELEILVPGSRCQTLVSLKPDLVSRYADYAVNCFEKVREILRHKPLQPVLIQLLAPAGDEASLLAGLAGLFKTAGLENPQLIGQVVQVDPVESNASLAQKLKASQQAPVACLIRYQQEKCLTLTFEEQAKSDDNPLPVFKEQGIYLITGGLGGLGRLFAREILEQTRKACIILTGRSPLNSQKESQLKDLQATGQVDYQAVDVSDPAQVEKLIESLQHKHGRLDGILHSAGVVLDNFILRKNSGEFSQVLQPKVLGASHLDQATRDLDLDFFVVFSSVSGVFGNVGQADYAAANAFLDHFAHYRNQQVALNQRWGKTLSLNWPLWKEGGMGVDAVSEAAMTASTGLVPLQTCTGLQAFYRGLHGTSSQLLVAEGHLTRIKSLVLAEPTPSSVVRDDSGIEKPPALPSYDSTRLYQKTVARIKQLFGGVIKLSVSRVDEHERLELYGIDSIMITGLNRELSTVFGELSKTLFFEYQTLKELTDYLIREHTLSCLRWTGLETETLPGVLKEGKTPDTSASWPVLVPLTSRRREYFQSSGFDSEQEPIAIIGLSGMYPEAATLEQFWKNLKQGRDSVTDIPPERWPLEGFYEPDRATAVEQGKSYGKWGGFVERFAEFDPLFFRISPQEALNMDPQERLFLQSSWQALEDAGYTRHRLKERYQRQVGVFAGITKTGFNLHGPPLWQQGERLFPTTSFSSVANRLSYFLDVQGPSMPIDTMCSASLTAIHEACEHIQRNECQLALAGGVNLYLHPASYVALCKQQMLSSDGLCRSFGVGGDGFVPGEGVGVVVLKRLEAAVTDGDRIHAVIRGSSVNHGGKTNGYTVPNPTAQAALIRQALDRAGVNARQLSYIEAHGTGTALGDPIEMTGLCQAFEADTQAVGFCRIGSVKSNIGHLEAAAGIAGLTKIILQMQHGQLVPSLHAEQLNPHIDFERTPFRVNRRMRSWERSMEQGRELSRLAGISSFGAGGANAHVIVEEYIAPATGPLVFPGNGGEASVPIPLSAHTTEQLLQKVGDLLSYLEDGKEAPDLVSLAYSLQTGREEMEERLGLEVSSLSELKILLREVLTGESKQEECYRGQVRRNKETLAVFTGDEELQEAVEKWIRRRKWSKVLSWWVKGLVVDWDQLYEGVQPTRLSLPTYPFARERYWLPAPKATKRNGTDLSGNLHPILHRNTSDLWEQRYSSRFTGEEFFLNDHRVRGEKVFPGVGYLEMARAAVTLAAGELSAGKRLQLKNVVWSQPLAVNGSFSEVHIGLSGGSDDAIQYEVYTKQGSKEELTVHSQGTAEFIADMASASLDVPALRSEMKQGRLSAGTCYQMFAGMGLDYGTGHQGVREIYRGKNQLLATLSLPLSVESTLTDYVLHPSLMDGAFQASVGLLPELALSADDMITAATPGNLKLGLPYALESLQIFGNCDKEMMAWVRYANGSKATDGMKKLDIDLCDSQGNIRVKLKGFSTRPLDRETSTEVLLANPIWQEQPVLLSDTTPQIYADHRIILYEMETARAQELEALVPGSRCQTMVSRKPNFATRYADYAADCFERVRKILEQKPLQPALIQLLVPAGGEASLLAGLAGLLKTAQLENPYLIGQVIQVDPGQSSASLAEKLKAGQQAPIETFIRYRGKKRLALGFEEQTGPEENPLPVFKERGVYLITGGLGGLGRLFASEILAQTREACVVLTGRSPLGTQKESLLKELQATGRQVEYRTVDVSDPVGVNTLIKSLQSRHGRLDGILHSAGVVLDNFILKKSKEEFSQVLRPKVLGTAHLDQATKNLDLDFFAVFSSVCGVFGNVGQVDYAAANAFLDHFAHYRNRQVALNRRRGKTLSLNWPLWKEGGMGVDTASEAAMTTSTGLVPLTTAAGLRVFHCGLGMKAGQLVVLSGNKDRLRSQLLEAVFGQAAAPVPSQTDEAKKTASTDPSVFKEQAIDFIKRLLASTLKLPPHRVQADEPLEKYGIDSILAMDLTNQLEKTFGSLPKTLFFEYQTLEELTRYFIDSYGPKLRKLLSPQGLPAVEALPPEPLQSHSLLPSRYQRRHRFTSFYERVAKPIADKGLAIAIIGISGRYPQAEDLEAYWANLLAGRDCITEVPQDRWDWQQYYTTDRSRSGAHFSKWGGFISGVAEFDPLFFNISPKEATSMDPQERLFLEQVWMAVEDAGYTRAGLKTETEEGLPDQVGVYVGVMHGEYALFGAEASLRGDRLGLNSGFAGIANRVSYVMNFQGPSLTVDTMCSSSLTAIHLACQDLMLKRTGLGIAGGVNVSIHPNKYLMLSAGQFISSRGHCESFGEGGDGYIPGEGVGVVLLKRLVEAEHDNDRIYGVIRSSTINHGGKTNGYSVPNPRSQQRMIEQALKEAGVPSAAVSYVEAHGTGTRLGDPIEISALTKAFGSGSNKTGYCRIGSAKSNIGHCESAAGIAGLTKVLLQMRYQTLVPSLHSSTLNPNIDFEATPFVVNQTVKAWERPMVNGREYPRLAGISSFGAGGSNAHLIVEEYQTKQVVANAQPERERYLIPLSAKNRDRLREMVSRLLRVISQSESGELALDLADVSYTLQVGREALEERLGLVVSTLGDLSEKLKQYLAGHSELEGVYEGRVKKNPENLSLFMGDEDLQAALSAWIAKGKHTRLLELWVQGLKVEWHHLYGTITPKRISLPPYPFARERYWIRETNPVPAETINDYFDEAYYSQLIDDILKADLKN